MDYIGNTDAQRQEMLKATGAASIDELFEDIPAALRAHAFDLPPGMSEMEVRTRLERLAKNNAVDLVLFLGGGFYDHYVPSAADAILQRGEFYTAYTPYQPEASQGTLQAIYEFQTALCRLTGMEVANASLYDGGTALFEAAMMALRITGRNKIILDSGVSPIYRNMLYCYTSNLNIEFVEVPVYNGRTRRDVVAQRLDEDTAAIIIQNPNFFGFVDDLSDVVEMVHRVGGLAIMCFYPISLGLLKTPGEMGVDVAVGEGQSIGLPLSFGGPYLGLMATRKEYQRQMPGRLVGATTDREGRRGFVLTLQTREQHIRREKATSNICTNSALCALAALTYLTLVGKEGIREVARLCADKAAYASQRLDAIPGVQVSRDAPFFNEFVCKLPADAGDVVGHMVEKGFAAGFPLGRYYPGMERHLLVALTERRTKEEIGA
ncbi:MAG: aminomethyl-transferring glycine dehydrogenase subunit GcvPA, partial [Candidatus Brocadiae bacterium]|nr:aminomethyl-transferring glycine dehydrogenase subunit GcvPA [Candidatus Brocadiia bacterium]